MSSVPEYPANDTAQQLLFNSWGTNDPMERFLLAERALQVFPFSVDAWNCIADVYNRMWKDLAKAEKAYENALACADMLWPDLKTQDLIEWGYMGHRPFLRAMHGRAVVQGHRGATPEAIETLKFLLRVNPGDNQGCRILLFQAYIHVGKHNLAEEIAREHSNGRESHDCYFRYGFVLIDFARYQKGEIDHEELETTLVRALQINNFVPHLLLLDTQSQFPESPTHVSPGTMSEAISYVNAAGDVWSRTDGCLDWLKGLRSRNGPKPDDDGAILFHLLEKGTVVVDLRKGGFLRSPSSEEQLKEVTTCFHEMRGQAVPGFRLAEGMKTHDPTKDIVCYATGRQLYSSLEGREGFDSFPYSSVTHVHFWHVLYSSTVYGETKREHYCLVCFKKASLRCSKCQVTYYCSSECQKKDWKSSRFGQPHKQVCENFIKR